MGCQIHLLYFVLQDAAVYAILPDCPLIEWPNDERYRFYSIVGANLIFGKLLNIEAFNWKHYYFIMLIALLLICHLIRAFFVWLF